MDLVAFPLDVEPSRCRASVGCYRDVGVSPLDRMIQNRKPFSFVVTES